MNTQYTLRLVALPSNDFVAPRRFGAIQSIPEKITVEGATFEPEITLLTDGKRHELPGGSYLNRQLKINYYQSLAEVATLIAKQLFGFAYHYSARLDFHDSEQAGTLYSFAISSTGAVVDITGL